jgi:1-deoxy-D-xylulose-5-phosphate synthase
MVDQKYSAEVVRLGIPDRYVHHGTQEELWADCGFDVNGIIGATKKLIAYEENFSNLSQSVS